ncbi:MAG TPA: lytic transglycosylase domain-containing protein [Puia sp.]|jgi:hypothetical protein
MLKSQMAICLCSSLSLLPTSATPDKSMPAGMKHSVENLRKTSPVVSKMTLNKRNLQFVRNYIQKSKENLVLIKRRSAVPFSIIDSVFKHYRLPHELKYLAVIESELNQSALSRVGALGPWQFMPGTAHILGLKARSGYDERRNYYKSTRAAARYLKDLYAEFGDWLLVIAAYNGGPGAVYGAISKSGSRNFWVLQRYLPQETRLHVKKFIATQYFFEGAGSVAGTAKAEILPKIKTGYIAPVAAIAIPKPVRAADPPRAETAEEKFQRLMKESEILLQKSNELLKKG